MQNEKMIVFLKELSTNEKARELLTVKKNATEDEKKAILETAKELGYDLTAEDFKAFAEELAQAKKTEAPESGRELSDDEIEEISGGENLVEMLVENIKNIIFRKEFWTENW